MVMSIGLAPDPTQAAQYGPATVPALGVRQWSTRAVKHADVRDPAPQPEHTLLRVGARVVVQTVSAAHTRSDVVVAA